MIRVIFCSILILLLVPFSQAFSAESTDNAPTLIVKLDKENIYVYQDSEGYTVVAGLVKNQNSLTYVTNVQIQASFFTQYGVAPLEVNLGSTTLNVIPPNGQSPFTVRSATPDSDIAEASVALLGFDSSVEKQKGLLVYSSEVFLDETLQFSGVLKNGGAPSTNTNVYLAFYDRFDPPRILQVSTIELGKVGLDTDVDFEFNEPIHYQAAGFFLFAESNVFYSDLVDVLIPASQLPTKKVAISNVSVRDSDGSATSELVVGSIFDIVSTTSIEIPADSESSETPYTYYVQIKRSSDSRGDLPTVEYIGKFDGRFIGNAVETQTIDWIPQEPGFFFIETFVWDRDNVPLGEQGPYTLITIE